jgi:hypothetical protein
MRAPFATAFDFFDLPITWLSPASVGSSMHCALVVKQQVAFLDQ